MPIEIRELIIKATVGEEVRSTHTKTEAVSEDHTDRQTIIDHCVAQVMELLKRSKER